MSCCTVPSFALQSLLFLKSLDCHLLSSLSGRKILNLGAYFLKVDMPSHDHDIYNTAVLKLLDLYSSLSFAPQHSQYTVLASFFLICSGTTDIKIISLGTGTKCLPANRLSPKGELVNDSHAEVLARRSAILWFLEEIQRIYSVDTYRSPWLDVCSGARYALREGVKLNLYISTIPCKFCEQRILFLLILQAYAFMKVETLPCAV